MPGQPLAQVGEFVVSFQPGKRRRAVKVGADRERPGAERLGVLHDVRSISGRVRLVPVEKRPHRRKPHDAAGRNERLDLQIKTLVSAGGIVGLAAVRAFLNRDEADAAAYAAHIVEYAETFGARTLAIGTDFYGAPPLAGLEGYDKFANLRERLSRHLTSRQIDAILYGNAEKFFNGSDP